MAKKSQKNSKHVADLISSATLPALTLLAQVDKFAFLGVLNAAKPEHQARSELLRVRIVREKGDTIIKEVPVYVPVQADAACSINRGFVRLHDAAAAGELPEPARDADAASAGIALSAVAGTVAANYQTCHKNAEKLRALQVWVSEMASGTK